MNKIVQNSLTLLVIGAGINSCGKPDDIIRPNVLFIMTDDHTQQAIHAYGMIMTPLLGSQPIMLTVR